MKKLFNFILYTLFLYPYSPTYYEFFFGNVQLFFLLYVFILYVYYRPTIKISYFNIFVILIINYFAVIYAFVSPKPHFLLYSAYFVLLLLIINLLPLQKNNIIKDFTIFTRLSIIISIIAFFWGNFFVDDWYVDQIKFFSETNPLLSRNETDFRYSFPLYFNVFLIPYSDFIDGFEVRNALYFTEPTLTNFFTLPFIYFSFYNTKKLLLKAIDIILIICVVWISFSSFLLIILSFILGSILLYKIKNNFSKLFVSVLMIIIFLYIVNNIPAFSKLTEKYLVYFLLEDTSKYTTLFGYDDIASIKNYEVFGLTSILVYSGIIGASIFLIQIFVVIQSINSEIIKRKYQYTFLYIFLLLYYLKIAPISLLLFFLLKRDSSISVSNS